MHVERIAELRVLSLGLWAEEQVWCPTAATNQDAFAVHAKEQAPLRCHLGSDLADAEAELRTVRDASVDDELQREILEHSFPLPELGRPPELRIRDAKLGKAVGRKAHLHAVVCRERDGALEGDAPNATSQRTADRMRREIPQVAHDGELRTLERCAVDTAHDLGIPHDDVTARREIRGLPDAHVLVRRRWIPVDPRGLKIGWLRREHLDGDRILSSVHRVGDIELDATIRSRNHT